MTNSWKPCPSPKPGDVIRWKEPLLAAPTQKRGKRDAIGEQAVVASVSEVDEFVVMLVEEVKLLSFTTESEPALNLRPGDAIRRRKASLQAGKCEKRGE